MHTKYNKGNKQKEQLNISCGKYLKNIFYENFEKVKLQLKFNTIKKRLTKKTSNTDCAALKMIAYIAQSVGNQYIGCQLFRSVYPMLMQPIGQARLDRVSCIQPHQIIERGYVLVLLSRDSQHWI